MECREIMRPIARSLFAEDSAATAIDFMMESHMGLVPVVDKDGVFVGLLSGDRLMHFMLPKTGIHDAGKKVRQFRAGEFGGVEGTIGCVTSTLNRRTR